MTMRQIVQPFLTKKTKDVKRSCAVQCLMTDATRLPNPIPSAHKLQRGGLIILRHYEDPAREKIGRALVKLARKQGLWLLVADDERLALRLGADGIHLPGRAASRAAAIKFRHPNWLVTSAAHNLSQIVAARGGDAVLISPVFTTVSHSNALGLGPVRFANLAQIARRHGLSVLALGGMSKQRLRRLLGTKASGFAAIGAFR